MTDSGLIMALKHLQPPPPPPLEPRSWHGLGRRLCVGCSCGWRTRSLHRCSQGGMAELAGAVPCHPWAAGDTWGQEGHREGLSTDAQQCVSKLCYVEGSF